MFALIRRTLRDRRYQVIVYSIASLAFLEMYIALFPALQKQSQQMAKLLETYPDSFWKAFNVEKSTLLFDKVGPFLGMEMFNFIWPILVIILAAGFAGYALANEVEKGTIEMLLSQPISRTQLFLARYVSGLINIIIFVAVTVLTIIPLTSLHGVSVSSKGVFALALSCLLFAWAIYAIAMLASAVFNEKAKVSLIVGGTLILMYVIKIIAGLKESLVNLQYFSFIYYFNATLTIDKANFVKYSFPVFIGVIVVATVLALFWYNRRDIAV